MLNEYNHISLDKFLNCELKPYLIRVGLVERMIIWPPLLTHEEIGLEEWKMFIRPH